MRKLLLHYSISLIVLSFLFSANIHAQANTADCQDEINISLGSECNTAIPWEEFNTWRPSCMLIQDLEGKTVAAISGNGNTIEANKFTCSIPIDSIWFDTVQKVKVRVHQIPGWTRNCDQLLNPDTVWIRNSQMPGPLSQNLGCDRDTFWIPGGVIIGGPISPINSVVVLKLDDDADIPPCPLHTPIENRTDGFFQFRDTVIEYSIEIFNKTIYRVDTFSHTEPLKWIKGTQIVNNNGVLDTVHDYVNTPPNGGFIHIGPVLCNYPEVFIEGITHLDGPAQLKPGKYKYNSYSPDSSNVCWGDINVEYKLWPILEGRKDTISCIDVSDYSRAESYNYNSSTAKKIEDVCLWAEEIVRGGPAHNPLTAIRTIDYVSNQVNQNIRHCYSHTITKKDSYLKNFEWLCDTVIKIRTFSTDHPSHGNNQIKELAKDTLIITPIHFDSIKFPDSLFAIKCGILPEGNDLPEDIAEYLYYAFDHFNHMDKKVVVDYHPTTTKYEEQSPCSAFASQYQSQNHSDYLDWKKVFQHADYNNWGVRKAFPYINRYTKTVDKKLKEKLINAGANPSLDASLWTMNSVSVPINQAICNINASRSDLHRVEACTGESSIYRTWVLVDWCTGQTKESTQIIRIIDDEAPELLSLDSKSISLSGDVDDDNSKGREDHYFGRNDISNHDGNDDLTDNTSTNDQNVRISIPGHGTLGVHWIKVSKPWNCLATYVFPMPDLKDHCSDASFTYELLDEKWNSKGDIYTAGDSVDISWIHGKGLDLPVVKLTSWDECGNDGEYFYYLKAIDKIPPIVELHDYLFVSLSNEAGNKGTAKITCVDVDAGSNDGDCGPVTCDMRRFGSDEWVDAIHFDCNDIGSVEVEVRITDYSGNTSIGIMSVQINNKNLPILICEDVTVSCSDPIHPDWVGMPHVDGICDSLSLEYSDEYHVDELCFTGYIDRTWSVLGGEVTCVQRITISNIDNGSDESVFDPESIHWPLHNNGKTLYDANWNTEWIEVYEKDAHGNCNQIGFNSFADATPGASSPTSIEIKNALNSLSFDSDFECELSDLKEPIWNDPNCGLIGKSYEDFHIKFNDGVCFKILRTWTVIDWCVYDPKAGDKYPEDFMFVVNGLCKGKDYIRTDVQAGKRDGYYSFVQEILVIDQTMPQFSEEKQKIDVPVGEGSKTNDDDCSTEYTITRTAYDECLDINVSDVAEDGTKTEGPELDWFVKLVKIDDQTGDEKIVPHPIYGIGWRPLQQGGNEIGHEEIYSDENQSSSASFTFIGAANETFHVKWRVEDGCNNPNEIVDVIAFEDVKAPVLQCYAVLSTNVMNPSGNVEIWANDFGEAFDCSGNNVPVWFKDENGELSSSLTFSCEVLEGNSAIEKELNIYAVDDSENESFCSVTLRIADGNNACGNGEVSGAAVISGNVRTFNGDMTELVEVGMGDYSVMTDNDGAFAFANNPMGLDYTLTAYKEDDYLNGVSSLDLVLIQKHILGLDLLDSPYKVIAADINNDGKVSSIDLVELRKLILDIISELPNNNSWRFADANQSFTDVLNPFPVKENIDINFLIKDTQNDFISIKVGDVNGNAAANSVKVDNRSNRTIQFNALDREVYEGDIVNIAVSSKDFIDLNAFQFTLNYSGLEYLGTQNGSIEFSKENIAEFEGALTAVWTNVNAITSSEDLFTLQFRAIRDVRLSDVLEMTSKRTDTRAYNSALEKFETTLVFSTEEGSISSSAFELMQNNPNPFQNTTTIGFILEESASTTLTIFDVTGKALVEKKLNGSKGYNEITLSNTDIGSSGILYYQLESGQNLATRKMILINE